MKQRKPRVYNDGICYVADEITQQTDFNAKKNGKSKTDYRKTARLMFAEQSKRERDLTFAENMGRSLSLKIKTPLIQGVDATKKIIIDNTVYDIINFDIDRKNREIYFYLEEVRSIA